jgi:hypothetical protein
MQWECHWTILWFSLLAASHQDLCLVWGQSVWDLLLTRMILGQVFSKHGMTNLWHSDCSVVLGTDEAWCVVIEVIDTDGDLCGDSVRRNA